MGCHYSTTTLLVRGETTQGKKVVIVAHNNHKFMDPKEINTSIQSILVNGAGKYSELGFDRLNSKKDDNSIFVIDSENWNSAARGLVSIEDTDLAIKNHPLFVPFCGGVDEARKYLENFKAIFNKKVIRVHCELEEDEDENKSSPRAKFLYLGAADNVYPGFYVARINEQAARFVGVKNNNPSTVNKSGIVTQGVVPSLQDINYDEKTSDFNSPSTKDLFSRAATTVGG